MNAYTSFLSDIFNLFIRNEIATTPTIFENEGVTNSIPSCSMLIKNNIFVDILVLPAFFSSTQFLTLIYIDVKVNAV